MAFYPAAFDDYAQRVIRDRFDVIEVDDGEAARFACNAVVLGSSIVAPDGCPNLRAKLEELGFAVYPVDLSEFLKAGGAAKCLTLLL